MVRLTRLNQVPLVVNSDLIELIETTPDTVISLTAGQKLVVRETPEQVINLVIAFRRSLREGTCRGERGLPVPASPRLVNDAE